MLNAASPSDFDLTFAKLHELQVAALMIGQDVLFAAEQEQLAKLSMRYKIPAIMAQHEFVAAGGLMFYGANQHNVYRQIGICWTDSQGRETERLASDAGNKV